MRPWLLLLFAPALLSAQVAPNTQTGQNADFRITTQLVTEVVIVKDRRGNFIEGLTADDFVVTENGVPQQIRFFEFQKLAEPAPLPPISVDQPTASNVHRARPSIRSIRPDDALYRNRRLLAFYFDLATLAIPDQLQALDAAARFVQTRMSSQDLVAILAFTRGSVQVLLDFTADRQVLLQALETLRRSNEYSEGFGGLGAEKPGPGASFGQNSPEFNIFFNDRQLSALQTAANLLGSVNAMKVLVYFTTGLRLEGVNNLAQLRATINAAVRAGVSLWPIDARGLDAEPPLGDARSGSVSGLALYTGAALERAVENRERRQDTLWTLAAETGGRALLDSNDLLSGIVQAQQSMSSHYILGYYTTNDQRDGKLRKVSIALPKYPGAKLEYRKSYYAPKEFSAFDAADREHQLEEAFMLEDPITDLKLALGIAYFQINNAEYFVNLSVTIPGHELMTGKAQSQERTRIEFIGEIKSDYGETVSNVRDSVDIKLGANSAIELSRRIVQYDTGFTLLPGRYHIKFLARDNETGRIGTYHMPFVILNLNKEVSQLPISSVVLGSQRVDLRESIRATLKQKDQRLEAGNPLVENGLKLLPSLTKVFRKKEELFLYLQVYQSEKPLAYVTFYRDKALAFETAPVGPAYSLREPLRGHVLRFRIPLKQFDPGEYVCQVNIVDPARGRARFWQSPVVITP